MLKSLMRIHLFLRITFYAICIAAVIFNSPAYSARLFFGRTVIFPLQKAAPGDGQIRVNFTLPANHEFAKEAPSTIFIRTKNSEIIKTSQIKPEPLNISVLPYSIAYRGNPGESIIVIDARVHFCDEVTKICLSDFVRLKFPVKVEAGASPQLSLKIPLKSKTARA